MKQQFNHTHAIWLRMSGNTA